MDRVTTLVTPRLVLRPWRSDDLDGLAEIYGDPEVMPAVEIGWRLGRPFWGHGYATEAARAALRFGFVERNLDRIISIRHVDNLRSLRVMEKLGVHFDRRTTVPVHEQPVDVFALTREDYCRSRGGGPPVWV
jgi:RimJ/RimL family protein N-acetyltransferase